MTNILNKINSLFPISDDTVQVLKENVTCCRFPKKYQLIKADTYCKSAFFIEKGITRSFWLVDGEEVTTSFAGEGSIVFSMDELYYGKISEEYVETLEEVEAYAASRQSTVDPRRFFEYFDTPDAQGRSWRDSKGNPVKNWKQKFLTWEGRDSVKGKSAPAASRTDKPRKSWTELAAEMDAEEGRTT